jgi:hypothetical protein
MKKVLTFLLSLTITLIIAQDRTPLGPKPIVNDPLACPSLVMTPVDNVVTFPSDLIENILGPDITSYTLVNFAGLAGNPNASAGLFNGGLDAGLGIENGIVLSSGLISNAIGPNSSDGGFTYSLNLPGDAQLSALAATDTYDATILEFDFVPQFNELFIEFVFGSEEYNEFVFSFNDAFAFYLNGINIALVPGTSDPVTINNINLSVNPTYYKNNSYDDFFPGPYPYCNEMDGLTTVLVASGSVNESQTNTIKLAIADALDDVWDSWVFIKSESFSGVDPEVPISNWALFIGIALIHAFAIFRFRR